MQRKHLGFNPSTGDSPSITPEVPGDINRKVNAGGGCMRRDLYVDLQRGGADGA